MIIKYSPQILAKLKKVNVRIRKSFKEKILIFSQNPFTPQLNNHSLIREYSGYRSIDITADYRALYEEIEEGEELVIYFSILGTHQELYGQDRN